MADTKTSDEVSATVLTGAELVRVVQSSTSKKTTAALLGHQHRGCRIERTSSHTAQNFTTSTAITFQTATLDTDSFWSAGAPTRATIPASEGFKVANVTATCRIDNLTADMWSEVVLVHRNSAGAAYRTSGESLEIGKTTRYHSVVMTEVPLVDGDYFDVFLQVETDTSIDVNVASTALCITIIGMEP